MTAFEVTEHEAVIHVVLKCEVCDWQTQDFINGQVYGANHCLRTGHTVRGEVGSSVVYEGTPRPRQGERP